MNGFSLHHESSIGVCSNDKSVHESRSRRNGFMGPSIQLQNPPCRDLDPSTTTNYENSYFHTVSKYVNDILMEEDLEGKTCMLQDCLALQATEKSFYDVLGQKYPPSPHHYSPFSNPDDNHFVDHSSICNQAEPGSCHTPISMVESSESDFLVTNGVGESDSFMPLVTQKEGRGRKNHHSEEGDGLEGRRNNKRLVPSLEESEQSDLFDELMIPKGGSYDFVQCPLLDAARNGASLKLHCREKKNRSNCRIMRMMKQGNTSEMVDLWSLLTQCAQAVASDDQRIATELLKQIRQYSSPFGDGTERLAHYFANGLEARLAGSGTVLYSPAFVNRSSVSDMLKAYLSYVSAVPFRNVSNFTTNRVIGKRSNDKSVHESSSRRNCFMDPTNQIQQPSCRDLDPSTTTNYENSIFSYAVSKYVNDILMEDDLEGKTCMLQDCLALQATEKSFYDVLGQKYPPSPFSNPNDKCPDDTNNNYTAANNFADYSSICNQAEPGSCHTPISMVEFSESAFLLTNGVGESNPFMPVVTEKKGRGRKNHHSEEGDGLEGRRNSKRSVPSLEESEQSDLFDELMFPQGGSYDSELFKKAKEFVKKDYHKDFIVNKHGQWILQGWRGKIIYALSFWKPIQE
ncbi:hypothetical protein Dsin_020365 [Dipteronia sinensis]|uniref:Uncharacterized protein n=1 Tax=Dipteronia sinensis TaxID=43782 RepID=A0AAE0A9Q7_9ROSI|nr:hypothetical protein Dsin_020365 [Dipteronia sinensis]